MSVMRVHIDQVAVRRMLRSPGGAVSRKVQEKGKQIEVRARELAGKHGHMGDYVHSTPVFSLLGAEVLVYCDHPAAIYVLKGTVKHDIPYKKAQPLLFNVGWRTVRVVHHPGYKGDDFLGKAMREAGPL